jgi:DNA polymerase-3 subunit delta
VARPGFSFCLCPDSELTLRHIGSLLEKQPEAWRMKQFWADEELPDAYWEALSVTGLLGHAQAVVLRKAESLLTADWKKFNPVLQRFRPQVWPFFCLEQPWSRGKPAFPAALQKQPFFRVAQRREWIWQSPGITRQTIRHHLEAWARSRNKTFSREALALAQDIMPCDGAGLKNELTKLELLTAGESEVATRHLHGVSFQPDMDSFAFLKALQSSADTAALWRKLLRDQLDAGQETVLPFLGLILWEARQLWQLAAGDADSVRLPPQIKKDKTRMARNMGLTNIAALWSHVMEAEAGIKSGTASSNQAMEILVSKLMQVFAH